MSEKVLVVVAEQRVTLYSTPGVEVACVVDGENVQLPDDWTGLSQKVIHSMPIYLGAGEMFGNREGEFVPDLEKEASESPSQRPETEITGTNGQADHRSGLMKAPYCPDCDDNHQRGIGCDGLPITCDSCGEPWGQLHARGCPAQIISDPDLDIVGSTEALENP